MVCNRVKLYFIVDMKRSQKINLLSGFPTKLSSQKFLVRRW
jgi:hypothetical protein